MSLDSIRARVEAASEGPWHVSFTGEQVHGPQSEWVSDAYENDAEFIAHARTDIPLLLKVAEAAKELEVFRATVKGFGDASGPCFFVSVPSLQTLRDSLAELEAAE